MKKKGLIVGLAVMLVLFFPAAAVSSDILIQIGLFYGTWMGGAARLSQTVVFSQANEPAIATLKSKISGAGIDLETAAVDILTDMVGVQTVDHLFRWASAWDGYRSKLDDTVLGKLAAYRIILMPKKVSTQIVHVGISISRTKEGSINPQKSREKELDEAYRVSRIKNLTENIFDGKVDLEIGGPIIIGIPREDGVYFLIVLFSDERRATKTEASTQPKSTEPVEVSTAPKPIWQVLPAYPDEIRRQRIEGDVGLRITIDKEGVVQFVEVLKSLHPYLDYAAVRALRQWTFEPILRNGKAVPVRFIYWCNFGPWSHLEDIAWKVDGARTPAASADDKLKGILEHCADYYRKITGSALDFICEESIKELHYNLIDNIQSARLILSKKPVQTELGPYFLIVVKHIEIMDPKRTEKNNYLCDYQCIRRDKIIKERRFLIKINGQKVQGQRVVLEKERFSVLAPLFACASLLEPQRQRLFNFRILDEDKLFDKNAYAIEAVPRWGNADGVEYGKVWVDKKTWQILKIQLEGVPLKGYDDVLKDCTILNITPEFTRIYEYRIEKNGLLFPSRASILVEYPGLDPRGSVRKIKTDLGYKKYKFFSVETESRIINEN